MQDSSFSCVLDKGTYDALSPPPPKKSDGKISVLVDTKSSKMLSEIGRVVKQGGRFICISLLQPHVAENLLKYFHNLGWMIRLIRCNAAENSAESRLNSVVFPVFMTVFTKIKLPEGIKPVSS